MTRGAWNQDAALLTAWVEEVMGGPVVSPAHTLTTLWGGYGRIVRYRMRDDIRSCVVKQIRFPSEVGSSRGHARKVRSYQVERAFYEQFAIYSQERARTPRLLMAENAGGELWLLLEDLDAAGYDERPRMGSSGGVRAGIEWLARFHSAHLGRTPDRLWNEGGYWHLGTRPDELRAIEAHPIHSLATELDERLRLAKYRTLIHGDPKLENFCSTRAAHVQFAAVDFQYVGGGVGIKDLVYFVGSAVPPRMIETELPRLLDHYFAVLRRECAGTASLANFAELENEWRELVPIAWLDFYRFTLGWSPNWADSDVYAKRLLKRTIVGQ